MTTDSIALYQWKDYYERLLAERRPQFQNVDYTIDNATKAKEITSEEVKTAVKLMRNSLSPGRSGLPIEFVKLAPAIVLQSIVALFMKCIRGEPLSSEWKIAHIIFKYKKGNKSKCENYRGLGVTSSMSTD